MLQRRVVESRGRATRIEFAIGTELTLAFAQAAKAAVADGKVPDDADLAAMKQAALGDDQSVSDDERMFMAGLLDVANARRLKATPFATVGDKIEFSVASITAARRARVANLDRGGMPADVLAEAAAAGQAARQRDIVGASIHTAAMETNSIAAVRRLSGTGTSRSTADKVIKLAQSQAIPVTMVLRAMIAAASDSTEGDRVLAGAVWVIAHQIGSPLQADVLAGRIKVDEVPASALDPEEFAAYKHAGTGKKGDTIYLPSTFDPDILAHRGAVVHELVHAEDDKAAGNQTRVQHGERDRQELNAYRRQTRFLLDTIEPLRDPDRTTAIANAAKVWNPMLAYAMALEARGEITKYEPIMSAINRAAPAVNQVQPRDLAAALLWDVDRVESFLLSLIRVAYRIDTPAKNRMIQEGLKGESILDWINRPLPLVTPDP